MSYIEIVGGFPLKGELQLQGSKNAVLPMLAACILHKGTTVLHHCPNIKDVQYTLKILEDLGCHTQFEQDIIIVDATNIINTVVKEKYGKKLRSSIMFLGALLGRTGEAIIAYPGGCSIGERPIDLHLNAMKQLGVAIKEDAMSIDCKADKIIKNEIILEFPSVGATENIILVSVLGEGITTVYNAAKEPEIIDFCYFLNTMGANIKGIGTSQLKIQGVKELHNIEYTILGDRIVASTYLAAVAVTNGELFLKGIDPFYLQSFIAVIKQLGCILECGKDRIYIRSFQRPKAIDFIRTGPYPEFPTDMQSIIMTVLTKAIGSSIIMETVFENRYENAMELRKLGANIIIRNKVAIIKGVKELYGTEVKAHDLRSGAALMIAGVCANGVTSITKPHYIERGYQSICEDFGQLGASIKWINE